MGKAMYLGVSGKARKVKKAYIGVDGKARKIKKMYIGDANGKARLFWSGSDVNPYLLISFTNASGGWRSASATADDFGSTNWNIRPTRDSHIFTIGSSTYKSYRGRIAFCYGKYFMNYNQCLMYSTDGDTWTKVGDVLFSGAYPRIMNGKLCYIGSSSSPATMYVVESDLTVTTQTMSATFNTQGNYNHIYLQGTFQFYNGYYYFVTSSGFSYGSQAGASGNGSFALHKCPVGSNSVSRVLEFGSWSYNYSGTTMYKMDRSIYAMHLCGSYMLIHASDRMYVVDLTSDKIVSESTDIYKGGTNSGHRLATSYRVNDNQFMIFFARDTTTGSGSNLSCSRVVTCGSDGTITVGELGSAGWWDWSSNSGGVVDYLVSGSSVNNLNKFAGVEDKIYFMTGQRKNQLPEIAMYYSLDFGVTWTANVITMSSEKTGSTSATTYKMLSKGVAIENDYI